MVVSFLTSRFQVHRSTIVVALLLLMLSTILMVPGLYISTLESSNASGYADRYEHGWPCVFLSRFDYDAKNPLTVWPVRPLLPPWLTWSGWTDWRAEESHQFFPLALFLNLIIHATAMLGLLFLWERRVRRQKHICQFKLSELALLSSIVAVTLAIFVHERKEYRREKAIVYEVENYNESYSYFEVYSDSPPAFWGRLVGSAVLPECFYRPSDFLYNSGEADSPDSILSVLPQLIELKKLDEIIYWLPYRYDRDDENEPADDFPFDSLTCLPHLRALTLNESLQYRINFHDAGKIVKLQQLTRLVINCRITPSAKELLNKHLPNCVIVYHERR